MRSGDDDSRVILGEVVGPEAGAEGADAEETSVLPAASDESEDDRPVVSRARRRPAAARGGRRRYATGIVAGAVALVLGFLLWSIPSVQAVARQSFTRIPTAYTELYFTTTPSLDGLALAVPITVDAHSINVSSFTVKVWLENAAGKTDYSTTVHLTPKHGIARTVLKLQLPVDAAVLWVNLNGQDRTLHYRVAGSALSTASS